AKAGGKARIVTNNHVVEGFTQLDVITNAGDRRKATLVGRDQITDLAVLEVDASGIKQVADFGDSDALRAGETVIAVGNPLGLGFAITINQAKSVIDTLIKDHKVVRPYIGVVTQELQSYTGTEILKLPADVKKGIIVLDSQGPAKDAGLKTNDVITELDGKAVDSTLALRKYIYGQKK